MTCMSQDLEDAREFAKAIEPLREILHVLVETDEATAYEIEKKTGMPHATVHKKLKQALALKMIEVKKMEKLCTGLTKKTYVLTPYGLADYIDFCFFFSIFNGKVEIHPAVHKKFSQMFLPQWQKFLKYVPESCALNVLGKIFPRGYKKTEKTLEQLQNFVLKDFIYALLLKTRYGECLDEILTFLNSEPELKKMFMELLNKRIESCKEDLISYQNVQKKIRGKNETNSSMHA